MSEGVQEFPSLSSNSRQRRSLLERCFRNADLQCSETPFAPSVYQSSGGASPHGERFRARGFNRQIMYIPETFVVRSQQRFASLVRQVNPMPQALNARSLPAVSSDYRTAMPTAYLYTRNRVATLHVINEASRLTSPVAAV